MKNLKNKIFNTVKTAVLCGYAYWKNPELFTNESFEFVGNIMKSINMAADEKRNFINQVATADKDTGKEIVKMSIWVGVYDCDSAQDNPFDRIAKLISERDEAFKKGSEQEKDRILQFLHFENIQRGNYSASKMCEVIIDFINKNPL